MNTMKDHLLTEQQWREKLTPEQFEICRNKGTENPFSGMFAESKEEGIYHCVCCGNGLFNSASKFDAGSGWPSFNDVLESESISQNIDKTHGMIRVEVTCQTCDAHLGHVFEDGPKPTGLRFCINSISLKFIKKDECKKKSTVDKALKHLKAILPLQERLEKCSHQVKYVHQQIFHSFLTRGQILTRTEMSQHISNLDDTISILKKNELVLFSEHDEPIGAYPFTMEPGEYKVLFNGVQVYATCALDALAISPMFEISTQITTHCRATGELINIQQSGKKIDNRSDVGNLHLGIAWGSENVNLTCAESLCMDIVFLRDKKIMQQWLTVDPENREGFNLEEAIEFSCRFFMPLIDKQNVV